MRLILYLSFIIALATTASADTLQVRAAGSLASAFTDLLRRFPAGSDRIATPEFGPSGLMRERIEAGAETDLFASADMEQAQRLAVGHPERMVINFTRNSLCAIARNGIGLTKANVLDRLLDPAVRVATSTPEADPGGDYTWAVFARADALRPGARAVLEAKAMKLYGGGPATPLLVPGKGSIEGIFLAERADVVFAYCSGAPAVVREVQNLTVVALPPDLSVEANYGMVLLNSKAVTLRFAAYLMSEVGQATLRVHGFNPVALVEPIGVSNGLLVQRVGQASLFLSPERIAALTAITQRVSLMTGHGEQQNEWTGPLLWDVLTAAGVIDPARSGETVHLTVRVTGSDGYVAVVALSEIAPDFAGHQVQLAREMNRVRIPQGALRLIVPGERRGARSVRDVVRIEVE